jgi:gamma-glutamylcyclotransferase (GGCT)/AIG2-like uncharacterized protein YtfP
VIECLIKEIALQKWGAIFCRKLEKIMLYYFAYGSNLHPLRLQQRVPSAVLIGTTELAGYQLKFHKRGQDDSAKCTLYKTESVDKIYGAVFQITTTDKPILDKFEGKNFGYEEQVISLNIENQTLDCFCYMAQTDYLTTELQPFAWYKKLVKLGAEFHHFPRQYITVYIDSIPAISDSNVERQEQNQQLIAKMSL